MGHQGFLIAGHLVDAQPLGHGLVHRVPGVEGARRVLQHQLDAATVGLERPRGVAEDAAQVDHASPGRWDQPEDRPGQRRLAAAGLADQGEDLALLHGQAHAVDGPGRTVAAARREGHSQVLDLERRSRRITHGAPVATR